jgi:HAD superfamily hydrolase (TIGR01549 family)
MSIGRRVSGIVFDMDGTLLDSLAVVANCYRQTVIEFGGPELTSDEVLAAFAIGPATVMLDSLIGRSVGADAVRAYESRLQDAKGDVRVYDQMLDSVEALASQVPLGVFTAADTSAAELLLRATGLRPYLGPVVGADRVARPKPASDGLIAVCDRLGVPPDEVAYVGDGPSDVDVARGCGAVAVAAAWGHQYQDGRNADVTLHAPTELLGLLAPVEHIGGAG